VGQLRKDSGTLKLEDEILRSILASSPDAITVSDLNGNIVECNQATLDLHGYSSKTEVIGKNALDLIAKKDYSRALENLKKTLAQGSVKNIEYTFVAKDGREFPAELSASVVRDSSGKPINFVAITKDITERKGMEEALRESEAKYSALVEQAKDVVAIVQDGVCKFVNRTAIEVSGFEVEELVGKPFMNWIAPESRDLVAQRYKLRMAGEKVPPIYEAKIQCKNGAIKDMEISAGVIKYQGRPADLAIARDVTERKRVEEEIERLAKFPSENPNPVLRLSRDGVILDANKACEPLFQYWGCRVSGEAPKFWRDLVAEVLASQLDRSVDVEAGERVYAFYIRPIKDAGYVNLYGRDVTDRKRAEEKLKHYAEHLEELVEDRTKEIGTLNESITQRLVQKISQIDNISTLRDRLRKSPDMSTGLVLILDTALNDLGMDVGAVLLIDRKENAVKLRGFKSKIAGVDVDESCPLDGRFVGLEAAKENQKVSKIVGKGEPSILKTRSIHSAPILFGSELYGILIFGSQKEMTLDESDLAVLGLYAELASTLLVAQSLTITPMKEVVEGVKRRFELEFSYSYLVKDNVEKAFEVFADNVLSGLEGLCITRQFPSKVREKYGLEKTPIVWLTSERAEGETTVHSIQDLSILIANFLEKTKQGVVLLDGLEYLITNHGFEHFIRFLQLNRSRFEEHNSIFIAPLLEKALDAKEVKLIERETRPLIAE